MRKVSFILVAFLFLFLTLAGCSSDIVKIEVYEWKLTLIQSNEDGSVVGCASEHYEMHKEIEGLVVIDLICSASDGEFSITDKTNDKSYNGTYKLTTQNSKSTIYEIATAENAGNAVTAYTKYKDGFAATSKTPTLIITLGDYTLNFQTE